MSWRAFSAGRVLNVDALAFVTTYTNSLGLFGVRGQAGFSTSDIINLTDAVYASADEALAAAHAWLAGGEFTPPA